MEHLQGVYVMEHLRQIYSLIDDCRYLAAYESYKQLPLNTTNCQSSLLPMEENILDDKIAKLIERVNEINEASGSSQKSHEHNDSSWILGSTLFEISTYYRRVGANDIVVKLEGTVHDLPIFEQCAVIHEVDLFSAWVPLCSQSILIEKIGKAELIAYMSFNIMGISRDVLLHAYGADCTQENDEIIIVGKSIDSYSGQGDIPWKPVGWFHQRLIIKEFKLVLHIESPTTAKTHAIAHVDLNAPVPQSVVNYVMTKVAGLFLYLFQRQVAAVQSAGADCAHGQRIQANVDFYRGWVLPKISALCGLKGWEQPVVSSLVDTVSDT